MSSRSCYVLYHLSSYQFQANFDLIKSLNVLKYKATYVCPRTMEAGDRGAIAPPDFDRFRSNQMIFYYCPIPQIVKPSKFSLK